MKIAKQTTKKMITILIRIRSQRNSDGKGGKREEGGKGGEG